MNNTQVLQSQTVLDTKSQTRKMDEERVSNFKKLDELASIDNQALFTAKGVFPFDLFPDTVYIDRNKISIHKHFFFFTKQLQSIMIRDTLTVVVEENLLFASLQIVDKVFPQETIQVRFLTKSDAKKIRWIVEALIVGLNENIDFTRIPNEDLIPKLLEIGKISTS